MEKEHFFRNFKLEFSDFSNLKYQNSFDNTDIIIFKFCSTLVGKLTFFKQTNKSNVKAFIEVP